MIKFSNDFNVEMPSAANTQRIPDKYFKTASFRIKSSQENILSHSTNGVELTNNDKDDEKKEK